MGIKDFYKDYVYNRKKGDDEDPDRAHYKDVAMNSRDDRIGRLRELHIDANSVIYSAVGAVYLVGDFGVSKAVYGGDGLIDENDQQKEDYIKGKIQEKIDELNRSNRWEVEDRVLELTYDLLVEIMEYFSPSSVATINFDGCAPWAKVMNQRRRRYATSLTLNDFTTFDTNSISPGTYFMNKLMGYLKERLEAAEFRYNVILSPSSVPGEGEHKIIDRIRASSGGPYMIYSPDSDMILLSMLLSPYEIYVCRGIRSAIISSIAKGLELVKPKSYYINTVHVGMFRDAASNHINNMHISTVDFVYALSLIGNDFLPKQYGYTGVREGVINIIRALSVMETSIIRYGIVYVKGLMQFLGILYHGYDNGTVTVLGERKMVENKLDIMQGSYLSLSTEDRDDRYMGLFHYYPYKVSGDRYAQEELNSMCASYITGMTWVIGYYMHEEDVAKDWYYPFDYAPLIGHLMIQLAEDPNWLREKVKMPVGRIIPTVPHQLLAIMPPASLLQVPKFMRDLWCKEESGIPWYISVDEEELHYKSEIEMQEDGAYKIISASREWHALYIVDMISCAEIDRSLSGTKLAHSGPMNTLSGYGSSDITYNSTSRPHSGRGRGTSSRGTSSRGFGDRGTSNRGTSSRGFGDRGTSSRGTSSRGFGDRGTSSRGFGNRGTSSRGFGNRGTSSRGQNFQRGRWEG